MESMASEMQALRVLAMQDPLTGAGEQGCAQTAGDPAHDRDRDERDRGSTDDAVVTG